MLDRDVTMRASTPARAEAARTASCRRLSAALGACDMDGGEKVFERGDGGEGLRLTGIYYGDHGDNHGSRRMNQKFLRGLLERQAIGAMRGRLRFDLPREIG